MLSKDIIENKFKGASEEHPVFARFDVYLGSECSSLYDTSKPCNKDVLVAVTGVYRDRDSDLMVKSAVLEGGEYIKNGVFFRGFQKYDWMYVDAANLSGEVLEADDKLLADYKDFVDRHANAPFKVTGAIYEDYPSYYDWDNEHRFPTYNVVDGTEQSWILEKGTKLSDGSEVRGLGDVEKWVIENHPAYLMGYSAFEDVPSGDFVMTSVPGPEYPVGFYETYDSRREYVELRAEKFGIIPGEELAEIVIAQVSGELDDDEDLYENNIPAEEVGDPAWDGIPDDIIPDPSAFRPEPTSPLKGVPEKDYEKDKDFNMEM